MFLYASIKKTNMNVLFQSIIATLIVSLSSLVGILFLAFNEKKLKQILLIFLGFSAGTMIGGAFFHLIPESIEVLKTNKTSIFVLIGFSIFFLIERILHWHHCHEAPGTCNIHTLSYMNLIGDAVHNLIDGMLISAAFVANINIGISTTIAVLAHEIPQEISDFGVLIYGGFSKFKALMYNFASALVAIFGAIIGYFISSTNGFEMFLLPFTAGGFIYISCADLIPEIHKEPKLSKSLISFFLFIIGVIFMYLLKFFF